MKVTIFLYDDFDSMNAFAAAEVFGKLPEYFHLEYVSENGSFVSSSQGIKVWTDYLTEETVGDILIIPGGKGARRLLHQGEKLSNLLKKAVEKHSFCVMLENGSAMLAQTGCLFRRRICDYPMDDNWKRMFTAGIYRMPEVRWVADGKFYSAMTSIDGIDMCLNILADLTDMEIAENIAAELGCVWNPEDEEGIFR